MPSLKNKLSRIVELRKKGLNDQEISDKLNLEIGFIDFYRDMFEKAMINAASMCYRIQKRVKNIEGAVEDGANSIQQVSYIAGLKPGTILKYEKRGLITLPKEWDRKKIYTAKKERPKIDELSGMGCSLDKIGKEENLSRERVRQYIVARGLYGAWREAKKRKSELEKSDAKQKKELMGHLVYLVEQRTIQLAKEQGWEYEKAIEYKFKLKHDFGTPFEEILALFKRYKQLKENGEKESLEDLALNSGLHDAGMVDHILTKVGLEPLYWKCKTGSKRFRNNMSDAEKETIKKTLELKMSEPDAAYFLNLSHSMVRRIRGKNKGTEPIKNFGREHSSNGLSGYLTYRLASQIYEARDLRFNVKEISKLLDAKNEMVWYALLHRKKIEPKIREKLKIINGILRPDTATV